MWVVLSLGVSACGERESRQDVGTDVGTDVAGDDVVADVVADVDAADGAGEVAAPDADVAPPGDGDDGGDDVAADADGEASFALACSPGASCVVECARGRCEAGVCRFDGPQVQGRGCVVALEDDPERASCVAVGAPRPDAPTCFFCNPDVSGEGFGNVAFADGFEAGGGQVAVEKLVANPATWSVSSARAATGTSSLYFGDAAHATYDVGERAAARASTRPLRVPAGTELTLALQLFADTEETPGFDRLRVLVDDGGEAREVWTSDAIGGTTRGVFVPLTIPLGVVPSGARVAFEADTLDGIINGFEGFYLDDLRIATTCCDAAAGDAGRDCDDNDLCTTDGCVASGDGGVCSHTRVAGCCLSDAHCDDGDPCTEDRCSGPGGTCNVAPIAGCCAAALDCDDGDPCTEDRCDGTTCRHAPLCCEQTADCDDGDPCTSGRCDDGQCVYNGICCRDAADCDDGLACTDDRCDDGTCSNAFTYAAGCCIPDVLTERFALGAPLSGWTLSPVVNNVGWQIVTEADAPSAPSLLYYGHKTLHFYETGGRNAGSAVTPLTRLPDGVELALSFSILPDIEASATRDVLEVKAVVGGELVTLVAKSDLVLGAWQEVSVDLSWAAGQNVQLRFEFDTIDGVANTRRGVFLDDVRLLSSCLAPACSADVECPGPSECLRGTCRDGVCRFGTACD